MTVIERLVKEEGRDRSFCSCKRCIDDVAALALNCLPPHYQAEGSEEQDAGSPWLMIETAVLDAMDRVKDLPHHDRNNLQ